MGPVEKEFGCDLVALGDEVPDLDGDVRERLRERGGELPKPLRPLEVLPERHDRHDRLVGYRRHERVEIAPVERFVDPPHHCRPVLHDSSFRVPYTLCGASKHSARSIVKPMSDLSTTSYAVLGLLGIKSWTAYELAAEMEHCLGAFWARAESRSYAEAERLVE